MNIILIGMPGCGKTTLGNALASELPDWQFIDLDEAIEQDAGTTIPEIFRISGEPRFRQMETDMLRRLLATPSAGNLILACGGGTPCHGANMELMNGCGEVVYLEASPEVLTRRLIEGGAKRPLVARLSPPEVSRYVADTIATREPFYSAARHRFNSDHLETPEEIVASVAMFRRQFGI